MTKRVFKNVGKLIAEMKMGDELEVRGFDIEEVYKIIDGRFNTASKKEREKCIFTYARHKYRYRSWNELKIPDLFSETMVIRRLRGEAWMGR